MEDQQTEQPDVDDVPDDTSDDGVEQSEDNGFDGEFDPSRARKLIDKLRGELKDVKAKAEQAPADLEATRKELADARSALLRERVGRRAGLPEELIDRLRGDDEESLLADAERLVELVAPSKAPAKRPTPNLRGGSDPGQEPEETDPRKLAAMVPRF